MPLSLTKQRSALIMLILGSALLLCFGLMSTVFGVPGILTAVIFSCFLVVVASALGCAINIHAIEKNIAETEFGVIRTSIEEQIHQINSIVLEGRRRIDECNRIVEDHPGRNPQVKNFIIAKRIVCALEIRLNKLLALVASEDIQQLEIASELSKLPLTVPEDRSAPNGSGDKIPELATSLWSDTLQMLLSQAEQELRQAGSSLAA